jgi:hypothetical protein
VLLVVSHQAANRVAVSIIQAYSSRVIGIKALRQQAEPQEQVARVIVDNLEVKEQVAVNRDQVSGVQRRVIHRSRQPGQVLPLVVHQRLEAMVAVAVKAVVQADLAVEL